MCQWKCVAFSQLLSPVHRTRTKTKNYYHHIYSALSATGNFYWLWKRKTVSRTELITYKHSRDRIEKQLWANSCQRWSSAFTTQISHPGKTRLPAMVRWWGQIKTSTETEGETESGKKKVASLPKNEINVRCLDISFYRIFINVYKYCVSFFPRLASSFWWHSTCKPRTTRHCDRWRRNEIHTNRTQLEWMNSIITTMRTKQRTTKQRGKIKETNIENA